MSSQPAKHKVDGLGKEKLDLFSILDSFAGTLTARQINKRNTFINVCILWTQWWLTQKGC